MEEVERAGLAETESEREKEGEERRRQMKNGMD